MHLITGETVPYHVSHETVGDLERAILDDRSVEAIQPLTGTDRIKQQALRQAYRVSPALAHGTITVQEPAHDDVLAVLMGGTYEKLWPTFTRARRKHLFAFDAWPSTHDRLAEVVQFYKVDSVMFTSRQVTDAFAQLCPDVNCVHIPEGIDPTRYSFRSLEDKDIDLLHFGRRYEAYHEKVVDVLRATERTYLFEQRPGDLVFADGDAFVQGLARTKICLCVPASITHPEKAKGVETMTQRYLQAMLAKAIPLGHCPEELKELFGYDPVVPINMADPIGQLEDILNGPQRYRSLVERNRKEVLEKHTWLQRWEWIEETIHGKASRRAAG